MSSAPNGGRIRRDELDDLLTEVRTAAYRTIAGKGNTNLAIGLATARIARAVSRDEHAVLSVSVRMDIDTVGDVCLSVRAERGRTRRRGSDDARGARRQRARRARAQRRRTARGHRCRPGPVMLAGQR